MKPIHNRMPVILARKNYERWMAPTDPAHLPVDLLRPFPADEMKVWEVDRRVGNVQNNDPTLVEPITHGQLRASDWKSVLTSGDGEIFGKL